MNNQIGGVGQFFILFTWLVALLAFFVAAFVLYKGLTAAQNTMQESSIAGISACIAIIPYCIARGVTEIVKASKN